MESKTIYREYFPGYMGHIPLKNEVIGMTVGATNEYIKSFLTREPEYEETYVPSTAKDYTYYNKGYFNDNMAKGYQLEEDKVFSNRSKEAKTWISGNKHKLYPQHIPGYTGHVTGIEPPGKRGSNIIGVSYAKATSIAIKGDYCQDIDFPADERYKTIQKLSYVRPKMRSSPEEEQLKMEKEAKEGPQTLDPYFSKMEKITTERANQELKEVGATMSDAFKKIINYDKKPITELPYIVGYKGFRRGVVAGNYYGKNFKEISLTSMNKFHANENK